MGIGLGGLLILKLRKLRIDGFKALHRVTFGVPRNLVLLIGANGSGKSSVLQALGLVRAFAQGDGSKFFEDRGWEPRDVKTQLPNISSVVRVDLLFVDEENSRLLWQFNWGIKSQRTVREAVWIWNKNEVLPTRVLNYSNRKLDAPEDDALSVRGIELKGSILSLIRTQSALALQFQDLADWAAGITSLELLSPAAMRGGARGAHNDIGERGEHLSSFLARMSPLTKRRIVDRLSEFYPLERIVTTRKRAGWIDLQIAESFRGIGNIKAGHVSDGFLRLLALSAIPELKNGASLILLDEIEDGIEPHILPDVIRRITDESKSQFILTSHSPILVNFVNEDEIFLMGRNGDGEVVASRITELRSIKSGLEYFGTGELWAMLDRNSLQENLIEETREHEESEERSTALHRYHPQAVAEFMQMPEAPRR
jgi:predicted ATPase